MVFKKSIHLLEVQRDSYSETEISRKKAWANPASVRMSEFYTAYQSGLSADIVFKIRKEVFDDKYTKVECDNKVYRITRTYKTPDGIVEVTCEEDIKNG